MKGNDYAGAIVHAHEELDRWGVPTHDEEGLQLTVSGRINLYCANNYQELTALRERVAELESSLEEARLSMRIHEQRAAFWLGKYQEGVA